MQVGDQFRIYQQVSATLDVRINNYQTLEDPLLQKAIEQAFKRLPLFDQSIMLDFKQDLIDILIHLDEQPNLSKPFYLGTKFSYFFVKKHNRDQLKRTLELLKYELTINEKYHFIEYAWLLGEVTKDDNFILRTKLLTKFLNLYHNGIRIPDFIITKFYEVDDINNFANLIYTLFEDHKENLSEQIFNFIKNDTSIERLRKAIILFNFLRNTSLEEISSYEWRNFIFYRTNKWEQTKEEVCLMDVSVLYNLKTMIKELSNRKLLYILELICEKKIINLAETLKLVQPLSKSSPSFVLLNIFYQCESESNLIIFEKIKRHQKFHGPLTNHFSLDLLKCDKIDNFLYGDLILKEFPNRCDIDTILPLTGYDLNKIDKLKKITNHVNNLDYITSILYNFFDLFSVYDRIIDLLPIIDFNQKFSLDERTPIVHYFYYTKKSYKELLIYLSTLFNNEEGLNILRFILETNRLWEADPSSSSQSLLDYIKQNLLTPDKNERNLLHRFACSTDYNKNALTRNYNLVFFKIIKKIFPHEYEIAFKQLDARNTTPKDLIFSYLIPENILESIEAFLTPEAFKSPLIEAILKIKNKNIAFNLFSRILERDPSLIFEAKENTQYLDFAKTLRQIDSDIDQIESYIQWDCKMNQSLPLASFAISFIIKHCKNQNFLQIKLALQTHTNFHEIVSMAETGKIGLPFPEPEFFFKLEDEIKNEFLLIALILRNKKAIYCTKEIIKRAFFHKTSEKQLQLALRCYESLQMHGLKHGKTYFRSLINDGSLSFETHIYALKAYCVHLTEASNKNYVLSLLTPDKASPFLIEIIKTLEQFTFDASESAQVLEKLKRVIACFHDDNELLQESVFLLVSLPNEEALSLALKHIQSPLWNFFDRDGNIYNDSKPTPFKTYNFRPRMHDNRRSMRQIILNQLLNMHEMKLKNSAEELVLKFKHGLVNHINLSNLRKNFNSILESARFLPFQVFLPPDSVVFRGICPRKGRHRYDASFNSLLLQGLYKGDLTQFETHDNGTWAKVGQVFSTESVDHVIKHYLIKGGAGSLIAIKGQAINELIMKRKVRFEFELGDLHIATYGHFKHHQICQIYVNDTKMSFINSLLTNHEPLQTEINCLSETKIIVRNLQRPLDDLKRATLKERITTCDMLAPNLKEIVCKSIEQLGYKTISKKEIRNYNLLRHAMVELLADHIKNESLKQLVLDARSIPRYWI